MIDDDDLLEKSICRKCTYCVCRTIIPLFPEDWISSFEELKVEEEEEIIMDHEFCTALSIDLDHAVIKCSLYRPKQECDDFIKHLRVFDM